ncbi:MAG: hypothetical protein DRI57_16110 [Deltaproteobacteria bacterium]|nr:MAG: hypothetical protein DRI57_16110 [Deltaproteobacteria bacterium]
MSVLALRKFRSSAFRRSGQRPRYPPWQTDILCGSAALRETKFLAEAQRRRDAKKLSLFRCRIYHR